MNLSRATTQAAGARAPSVAPLRPVGSKRRPQAFKGSRKPSVAVAAEQQAGESAAPAAPKQQQQQRQRRAPRNVTVQIAEVQPGQEYEGTVSSVETYGAFVNIGAETDGLVHVSQLTDGYVKNVADVVKVGASVKVKVLTVDAGAKRLALTMKGMGNTAPARGGKGGPVEASFEEETADDGDDGFALEAGDIALDGLVFRVDDAAADEEGYDEADEFEAAAEADVAAIAALENSVVRGTVASVEDFGVVVEWTDAKGAKQSGLLHVSEMRAPASAAEAELGGASDGGDGEGEEGAAAFFADEGEFTGEAYVDVGGVDKPSRYYKAGDAVSCFVMAVEGRKLELTQNPESLALDDAIDEEGEAGDAAEARAFAAADPQAAAYAPVAEEGEEVEGLEWTAASAAETSASIYYGQSNGAAKNAGAPAFIRGKRGAAVAPGAFPSRGYSVADADLRVAAASRLVDIDDAGEEAELVDYWTNDGLPRPSKVRLAALGAKIEADAEGALAVVPRDAEGEGAAAGAGAGEAALELLAGITDADLDAIVADLLADEEDEAEVPLLARRAPGVFAMSVETISAADVKKLRQSTGAGMMDCKKALKENAGDFEKATEWLRQKGLSGADKKAGRAATEGAVARYIHPGSRLGVLLEVNCETDFVAASEQFQSLVGELGMIVASTDVVCVSAEDMPGDLLEKERQVEMGKEDLKSKPEAVRAKIVEGRLDKIKRQYALLEQPALRDNNKSVTEIIKETIAAVGENIQVRRFVKFRLGEGLEKKSADFAAEVAQQTQAKADKPKAEPKKEEKPKEEPKVAKPAVAVSASEVKALRESTGAGMMDCKKALAENGGDAAAAAEWLRKKGLSGADKKAGRLAAEGAVAAYIHPGSRLGVLLEVNCETDFVAAGESFNQLVNGLAMQIAASPALEYVSADEIPPEVFAKELEVEMGREDLQAKPEPIRKKIAEGRVKKIATERALLEQPYLIDPTKTVAEAVKATIASVGENVQIRRFERFVLGEGLEKKVSDLAADVAAATGGRA
ncbi:elongation factor Ts [Raphidocelis subcapitata]|uniref:Elongation factor Ts, mitochondrial n=1 Tax=Raphidocelis subcapitata TaxID=307507 RepID=A0A2V0P1M7_9CHLO|nr:elongation factor Ts [Raphidocelis subcapitata]|eukprot:GBF93469.1 elongation factor Ts [Raphidocelis subcapitata]